MSPPRSRPAGQSPQPALPTTERAELQRQGAKAAARGEQAGANPMNAQANRPTTTGECQAVWAERRDAWQDGHDVQSRVVDRTPGGPADDAAAALALSRDRLLALHRDIDDAQATLSRLRHNIVEARGEDVQQALRDAVLENERLHAALHDANLRAVKDADSASMALQDAVRASETDPLTRLPNRVVLWDRLSHDLALAKRHQAPLAVLFLDLDRFKEINDQWGHDVGDLVLQHVARVLGETMRASDSVCRMGGDEFVVVANGIPRADLAGVVEKVLKAVAVATLFDGHLLSPSLSIGAASYPEDGDQPEALVRAADAAMYLAKGRRRSAVLGV